MAENSKIEWTDHTFNPWIGCTKVSPGCTNCYAAVDTFARRERSHGRELWGPRAERHRTAEAYWKQPLKWNRQVWQQCVLCGWRGPVSETHVDCPICDGEEMEPTRQRVFCSSLADVFEDHPQVGEWRTELFALIEATPNLDWLLLTKRPENISNMVPYSWVRRVQENVWLGTSVENQKYAEERIPALLRFRAKVHFLSCEPLLSEVDISAGLPGYVHKSLGKWTMNTTTDQDRTTINWVICGGESGPHSRPMHPDWARSLRDQCQAAGVPFFFKQWGEYGLDGDIILQKPNTPYIFTSDMQVPMWKAGKKFNGRELDGVKWNQVPS